MSVQAAQCPRCGNLADNYVAVDGRLRASVEGGDSLPEKICVSCYDALTASFSQGTKLRMERDTREKNKMMAWKNRVHLIKNARGLMNQKAYSEAAVQYEKYIRVLEMVYNLKRGELSPAVFNNSSRSKELTLIASVYWDLLRIYDTSPRYGDRMQRAAEKLSQFLQFSPIYPDIVKKAEQFAKTAKNPQVIRSFLRSTRGARGPCFIATAAFADEPYAFELTLLRRFRDQRLRPYRWGRCAIWIYYRVSPAVARALSERPYARRAVRWTLTKISARLKKSLNSP
jgi:hypothetical protein